MSEQDERYTILHNGEVIKDDLTREEMFNAMEDLSIDYYQKGFPHPSNLEVKEKNFLIN
jgi:hypothetical protein